MPNFFDYLKAIYLKDKNLCPQEVDIQLNMTLSKWITFDTSNLNYVKSILPYMFYIQPKNYFILLYTSVSKKDTVPFLKKPEGIKTEEKESELHNRLKKLLQWSDREFELNKSILEKTILKDEKYWETELGIK